jgi:hypothetical protein
MVSIFTAGKVRPRADKILVKKAVGGLVSTTFFISISIGQGLSEMLL